MEGLVTTFAVGSPGGPRSAIYSLSTMGDDAIRVEARAPGAGFTVAIATPRAETGGEQLQHQLTRDTLRRSIARSAWLGGDAARLEWPSREVYPNVREQLSLCFPGTALRKFTDAWDGAGPTWIPAPPEFGQVTVSVLVVGAGGEWRPPPRSDQTLFAEGRLSDGRRVLTTCRTERTPSDLQKAGLFSAIRKRGPPELPQERLMLPGTRLVLAALIGEVGTLIELAGDMFYGPGNC